MALPNILVIDDEQILRKHMTAFLEDEGFTVYQADSIESAKKQFFNNDIDACIVDYHLPEGSGESLVIEFINARPNLECFICTGALEYELSPRLQKKGLTSQHIIPKSQMDLSSLVGLLKSSL